jgi:hypothetical protein
VRITTYRAGAEGGARPPPSPAAGAQGPIIEGEFERLGEKTSEPHRGKDRDQV